MRKEFEIAGWSLGNGIRERLLNHSHIPLLPQE